MHQIPQPQQEHVHDRTRQDQDRHLGRTQEEVDRDNEPQPGERIAVPLHCQDHPQQRYICSYGDDKFDNIYEKYKDKEDGVLYLKYSSIEPF